MNKKHIEKIEEVRKLKRLWESGELIHFVVNDRCENVENYAFVYKGSVLKIFCFEYDCSGILFEKQKAIGFKFVDIVNTRQLLIERVE